MTKLLCCTFLLSLSLESSARNFLERIPLEEQQILSKAASQYSLTRKERELLYKIRIVENGTSGSGIEMGVGQEEPSHPARRFAGDPKKSLMLQAQWAAGTIKKRFRGSVEQFAKRWCPRNWKNWSKLIKEL